MKGVWIVPHKTLLAVRYIDNVPTFVEDQTVWVVDKYEKGYLWGTSYTTINGEPVSKRSFIGSISDSRSVLINFNNQNSSVTGVGKFKHKKFIMQMNNLTDLKGNNLVISHWSYMIKVDKTSKLYWHLPGTGEPGKPGISVPEFISLFS